MVRFRSWTNVVLSEYLRGVGKGGEIVIKDARPLSRETRRDRPANLK